MRALTVIALLAAALFVGACSSTLLTDPTAATSATSSPANAHGHARRTGYLVAAGDR